MIANAWLDAKAARQERSARGWQVAARRLIDRKVADAHAHAEAALTEALREAPDGRSTTNRVRRSRSASAAIHRLGELLDGLAGPSVDSLEGLIRDGRERLLAHAFAEWSRLIEPEFRRADPKPTEAERRAIRRYEAHGLPLREELKARTDAASRQLMAAIAQAGGRGVGSRAAGTILRTWRERAADAIASACSLALSDSAVIADTAAQWLLIRPEFRGDDDPPIEV